MDTTSSGTKGAPLNRPAVERQCASVFVRSFPVFDGEEITTLKESARVYAQALALEARVREGDRGPAALKRIRAA
jgi:hypothetical protein